MLCDAQTSVVVQSRAQLAYIAWRAISVNEHGVRQCGCLALGPRQSTVMTDRMTNGLYASLGPLVKAVGVCM